jgi:hypothetical protein
VSTVDDLARFADALIAERLLSRDMRERVMTGYVDAAYGGRHGYGFETRVVNGIRIAGHQGGFTGIANQVDIYPDLGYTLVVLGNTDGEGAQKIAGAVRALIGQSAGPMQGAGRS